MSASSLKSDEIVRELMDDKLCLGINLAILPTCLMNPETAVTCNRGHFNQVFFAVYNCMHTDIHVIPVLKILAMGLLIMNKVLKRNSYSES